MLQHGDLSWVVPGSIIAFSSPTTARGPRYSGTFRPDDIIETLHECNVKGIIRLNDKLYNASEFTREGIKVHEMEFPDGSCPSDSII